MFSLHFYYHLLSFTPSFPHTYLLLSLLGVTEPAGSTVAQGTCIPGLGMAFEDERGAISLHWNRACSLHIPPVQMLEAAQESQASRRDAPWVP